MGFSKKKWLESIPAGNFVKNRCEVICMVFIDFRNKLQTSYLRYAAASFIALMLFLSTGYDLFHNHQPDFEHHEDCPVYQFLIVLGAVGIVGALVLQHFLNRITILSFHPDALIYRVERLTPVIRGPPDTAMVVFFK